MLKLNNLSPAKGSQRSKKRLGRGNASGHGTYSTRGVKGQRARSGGKKGLKLHGFRQNLLNIPKNRGFNSGKPKNTPVNVGSLESVCQNGDAVNPDFLKEKGIIDTKRFVVKILAMGTITKKIIVSDCLVSEAAKVKIEQAGGQVKQ